LTPYCEKQYPPANPPIEKNNSNGKEKENGNEKENGKEKENNLPLFLGSVTLQKFPPVCTRTARGGV
jgi:hypothetical protein